MAERCATLWPFSLACVTFCFSVVNNRLFCFLSFSYYLSPNQAHVNFTFLGTRPVDPFDLLPAGLATSCSLGSPVTNIPHALLRLHLGSDGAIHPTLARTDTWGVIHFEHYTKGLKLPLFSPSHWVRRSAACGILNQKSFSVRFWRIRSVAL